MHGRGSSAVVPGKCGDFRPGVEHRARSCEDQADGEAADHDQGVRCPEARQFGKHDGKHGDRHPAVAELHQHLPVSQISARLNRVTVSPPCVQGVEAWHSGTWRRCALRRPCRPAAWRPRSAHLRGWAGGRTAPLLSQPETPIVDVSRPLNGTMKRDRARMWFPRLSGRDAQVVEPPRTPFASAARSKAGSTPVP